MVSEIAIGLWEIFLKVFLLRGAMDVKRGSGGLFASEII